MMLNRSFNKILRVKCANLTVFVMIDFLSNLMTKALVLSTFFLHVFLVLNSCIIFATFKFLFISLSTHHFYPSKVAKRLPTAQSFTNHFNQRSLR